VTLTAIWFTFLALVSVGSVVIAVAITVRDTKKTKR
jgi:hypothetical protein